MKTKNILLLISVALIIASFVLIMYGLTGQSLLWQIGLAALALAMFASLATVFAKTEDEEKKMSAPKEEG